MKKLKRKKIVDEGWGIPDESEFEWADAEYEAPAELTPDGSHSEDRSGKHGRRLKDRHGKGKGHVQVTLAYDKDSDKYKVAADGLAQGVMMQEIITMRNIIPNWDVKRWSEFVHNMGALPCWVLWSGVDYWHMMIYGCEVLRQHPEAVTLGHGEIQKRFDEMHPNFDIHKWSDEQDGKMWGGVPVDHPQYRSFKKTVAEQMAEQQKAHIEQNLERSQPSKPEYNEMRYGQEQAELAKWALAERMAATKPRKEWEGVVDRELESMIKYCYGWLRDIGEIPGLPFDKMDLFWPRPRPGEHSIEPKIVKRRHYATGKVMKFWQRTLKALDPDEREALLLTPPLSYRVVLAAQVLTTCIEDFAVGYQMDNDDEELLARVKRAAVKYFKAHLPVSTQGASPGPLATQDPDYPEYLRLCEQYGIKVGTFLHDLDL